MADENPHLFCSVSCETLFKTKRDREHVQAFKPLIRPRRADDWSLNFLHQQNRRFHERTTATPF